MPQRLQRQPISPARRWLALASLLVVVAVFLPALPGCDEAPLDLPTDRTGVISGRVHDGMEIDRYDLTIYVESPYGVVPRVRISGHPDDDGRFWLVVPEGPVIVRVDGPNSRDVFWGSDGPTPFEEEAERIEVRGGVRDLDFACGRLRARIAVPPAMAGGLSWQASLVRADDLHCVVARPSCLVTEELDLSFRALPPGRYFLQLKSPWQSSVFVPATFDTADAEILTVRAGEELQYEGSIADVATLCGTVTGSWQTLGFDRPTVKAFYGEFEAASSRAAEDGGFSVQLLAGGTFRLYVAIGAIGRWVGGESFDAATLYSLDPGQTMTGISHVESGFVCEYDPAGPIPRHMHDLILYSTTGVIYETRHWSEEIRFANLPPGDIFLKVSGWGMLENWLPQYWDRRETLEEASPITIPAGGGVARVTMTLIRGGQVLGRLLDAQGRTLSTENLFLMAYAPTDSFHPVNLYTNWDFEEALYDEDTGEYVLTQLRDGQYKMRARAGDTPWTWWPGRASWDSAAVFTIENATYLNGVDWRLSY